jgi:hypothetical protein
MVGCIDLVDHCSFPQRTVVNAVMSLRVLLVARKIFTSSVIKTYLKYCFYVLLLVFAYYHFS